MAVKQGGQERQRDSVPYYDRLSPIFGGLEFIEPGERGDKRVGEIRVFDDKENDVVHTQFRQELRRGLKVATFHSSFDTFSEMVDDLIAVRDEMEKSR